MPVLEIRNVTVDFPYDPYAIQKEYMEKVIECLQNKQNAVLESPTGTGKTLCLLCSSLAWLRVQTASFQLNNVRNSYDQSNSFLSELEVNLNSQIGKTWSSATSSFRPPKIVYASRTHSQLNQVMLELKKTSYRDVKVAILGSRDQLCINPTVMKEKNVATKIQMCKTLITNRQCNFHNNIEKKIGESVFQDDRLIDIEDLLKKGKRMQCCPYYATRELQKNSQILFTPYNYLLDPKTRRAQDINLQSDIIIFDEGHNIEKMCEESASTQLSSSTIALCINEVTWAMKAVCNSVEDDSMIEKNTPKDFSPEDLELLKVLLLTIENAVDKIVLDNEKSRTFPGSHIFNILAEAEINERNNETLLGMLDKVSQYLVTINESNIHQRGAALAKFAEFLEIVFNSTGVGAYKSKDYTDQNYKLYVELEDIKPKGAWSNTSSISKSGGKILNFWCFNPGFGMRSLVAQGVHSIILTSGTLSPLEATISEIGIPVDVQLSNQHVIKSNQICAVVVEKGPGNTELRCVYENRSNNKYLTDLGQTCLNFYRLIPGGILVFFPSYPFLKACVEFWKSNGIWDKMANLKALFLEPQNKDELKTIMDEYYNMISERGASILAVCRGKISEGLDFSDDRARAVIVIGLPYPPFKDPKVTLKREYLNNGKSKKKSLLDGNEWYQLEAMRAVNQAIGRVIRHAGDHGAIIFCDCRFSYQNNTKSLSKWLQTHIKVNSSFGQTMKLINDFFKSWKDKPAVRTLNYEHNKATPTSFQSSFPQSGSRVVKKLLPNIAVNSPTTSVDTTNYVDPFSAECCSKYKESKISQLQQSNSQIKRKSILEALDDNENEEQKTNLDIQSIGNTTSNINAVIQNNTIQKKRKLIITKPIAYDNSATKQKKPEFSLKEFLLKIQKRCTPQQIEEFKIAITKYKSGVNTDEDADRFFDECSKCFRDRDNKIIADLFRDIPNFLKNDSDISRFGNFYYQFKKNY